MDSFNSNVTRYTNLIIKHLSLSLSLSVSLSLSLSLFLSLSLSLSLSVSLSVSLSLSLSLSLSYLPSTPIPLSLSLSLGVHISFVRSVSMDSWNEKQIKVMRMGGNQKCIDFLHGYGITKLTPIQEKYHSAAAQLYKVRVKVKVRDSAKIRG
jgi:hypothetical protein